MSELLTAAHSGTSEASEAANALYELTVDSGFRGSCTRPVLMSLLAEYETTFLQMISIGKPLPETLSLITECTRFISPGSAQELPESEISRWTRIVSQHLHSLAFQPEWSEEHLIQYRHALILGERLFLMSENEEMISESLKSLLAKATTDTLKHMNNLGEFLREKPLCAEILLQSIGFLQGCQATSSGEVLQQIFHTVHRVYQEMTPQDCDVGDYFKFEGEIWNPAEDFTDNHKASDNQGVVSPSAEYGSDDESIDRVSLEETDSTSLYLDRNNSGEDQDYDFQEDLDWHEDSVESELNETEVKSVDEENSLYHATENLHLALLRSLKVDPIVKGDSSFWNEVVYENNYYMPGMPIAIQGLVQNSRRLLEEFIEPLLYSLSRDRAPIVHLLALMETSNSLRIQYGVEVLELLCEKYQNLPAHIQQRVLETIEQTVASDLFIMAELSESELCEDEMASYIGELLSMLYDHQ